MKKLVRKLSTRKPESSTLTAQAKISKARGSSSSLSQADQHSQSISASHLPLEVKHPSASGTQPGFIPFGTTLHFPACPHTIPPTPRPANIPPVLLTQVSSSQSPSPRGSREHILATDSDDATRREAVVVNQFFTSPRQCLDCTLSLARESQRMTHEAFDAKIRAGRRRIGLACADLAAAKTRDGRANCNNGALCGEIFQAKQIVHGWMAKRDEQVKSIWDAVIKDWEGGVREVVYDDGSGEGLEKCSFRSRSVPVADADVDGSNRDGSAEAEGGWCVDVVWESID
ncbi:uncharacterized protein A1O9_00260 [Exophiala aquamarina CBS 119918]|uniref:Uncharacterized protein n=1 Tax=Exophiala aquamarina CBS 119918 TaxID=1182545 RepID=A0A072PSK0_9EURO|nr:uncharacterized protein A1O9_00260 [Exophiala aquamarina CBS 119918]KEF62288.1 hypothetical protein A1O9_00260 [Exophiala aquamarina CBS 119918]